MGQEDCKAANGGFERLMSISGLDEVVCRGKIVHGWAVQLVALVEAVLGASPDTWSHGKAGLSALRFPGLPCLHQALHGLRPRFRLALQAHSRAQFWACASSNVWRACHMLAACNSMDWQGDATLFGGGTIRIPTGMRV
jgi:hypothetical protein